MESEKTEKILEAPEEKPVETYNKEINNSKDVGEDKKEEVTKKISMTDSE
jgi:hypothetical protein